jgi:hypothetical protein
MMSMRRVALPPRVAGSLWLDAMPGRGESLARTWRDVTDARVDVIVALADLDETRRESPDYASAIAAGTVPCARLELPAPDYGVPGDRSAFSIWWATSRRACAPGNESSSTATWALAAPERWPSVSSSRSASRSRPPNAWSRPPARRR